MFPETIENLNYLRTALGMITRIGSKRMAVINKYEKNNSNETCCNCTPLCKPIIYIKNKLKRVNLNCKYEFRLRCFANDFVDLFYISAKMFLYNVFFCRNS